MNEFQALRCRISVHCADLGSRMRPSQDDHIVEDWGHLVSSPIAWRSALPDPDTLPFVIELQCPENLLGA